MTTPPDVQETAREGAASVFGYVASAAETTPDGARWQTLDYGDRLHYGFDVFNGVAGIPLFLAAYYARTGAPEARELALAGARWCEWVSRDAPDDSLCFGRGGVALAWLELARVTGDGDGDLLARATATVARLVERDPGPVTDFLGGAAGEVILLVRLWGATRDERHLEAAVRRAAWLESRAVRDAAGCRWPMHADAPERGTYLGFAHGIAGIGHALLTLYEATRESRWAALAREVATALDGRARADRGGLNWPALDGATDPQHCQWCHGSPGVGLFYAKLYETLGDASALQTATGAGETTFAYGDVRGNPSQCHGLAGNAELFLELARLTGAPRWLERAHDFAQRAFAYRTPSPAGDTWQADAPGHSSPDFLCGAAGVGHFFLRLEAPETLRMPLQ